MVTRPKPEGAILHVTSEYPPIHFGGLGTAVAGLVRAQAEAGVEVVVLLVHGPGYAYAYGGYARSASGYGGYGRTRPDAHGSDACAPSRPAVEVVRASHMDAESVGSALAAARRARVVHLHASWLWPIAAGIRDATGVGVVYTAHSVDRAEVEHGEWLPHGSIQDRVFVGADRVVMLSESERDYVRRHYPHLAGRISVVGNGVHPAPLPPAKQHRATGAAVLYVGRFGSRKGVRDLIEAVPGIARRVPAARFVFVGGASPDDGPREAAAWVQPELQAHLGRMTFLGWQDAPSRGSPEWYARGDVLVVPSRYEPFGMVVLEGMLHGQAIVAAATGGPAELLRHGRTALLYPPGDVDALAASVARLLGDVRLRRCLGAAARAEVQAHRTWANVLPALEDAYARARAAQRGARSAARPT